MDLAGGLQEVGRLVTEAAAVGLRSPVAGGCEEGQEGPPPATFVSSGAAFERKEKSTSQPGVSKRCGFKYSKASKSIFLKPSEYVNMECCVVFHQST